MLALLAACSGGAPATPTAKAAPTDDGGAPAPQLGFRTCTSSLFDAPGDERIACTPRLPAEACGPTARAAIGGACEPVGIATCAPGFARDPDGPGCLAVLATTTCTGATRAALGERACVRIGDCSAAFPPPGASVVVDASFTNAQLDATHVRTIAAGLAAAPVDGLVAVAPGTYLEDVSVTRSVSLVGRCAERVVVRGTGAPAAGVRIVGRTRVTIAGLTLTEHGAGGLVVEAGATVRAEELVVSDNVGGGLAAGGAGTRLTLERVAIRDARPGGPDGLGLGAISGAQVVGVGLEISRSFRNGVVADGAATKVDLTDAVVLDTRPDARGAFGMGLFARRGAALAARRVAIVEATEVGVGAVDRGTSVDVADVTVERTRASGDGLAHGLYGGGNAELSVERATIADAERDGVLVERGARLELVRSAVLRTHVLDGEGGVGASATDGASLHVVGTAVVGNEASSLVARGAGSEVVVEGALVAGAAEGPPDGYGITVEGGAAARVTDAEIRDTRSAGAVAIDPGSTLALERALIAGAHVALPGVPAFGVAAQSGAAVTATATVVRGAEGFGVLATLGGSFVARELVVEDVAPLPDGTRGRGVQVTAGSTLDLSGALVRRVTGAAFLLGTGSRSTVHDLTVEDVREDATGTGRGLVVQGEGTEASFTGFALRRTVQGGASVANFASLALVDADVSEVARTAEGAFGHGLIVVSDGRARAENLTVADVEGVGVLVAGASAVLAGGAVRRAAVGLHTQGGATIVEAAAPPDDVPALRLTVVATRFEGNGIRIGAGALPLPAPPSED